MLVGKFSWNIKSTGIQSVVQYWICARVTLILLTILLRFWTNICPYWLDVMYQPRSSLCITRISHGLMINAGMLLASSRRLIFGGPLIALGLLGKFCRLSSEYVGKADLLSCHFDSKQSRKAVDQLLTCQSSPCLTTFVFRLREVRCFLLCLDPYSGTDPFGVLPLFLKRTADVMAPCLNVVFPRLVRRGSFPSCWRQAHLNSEGSTVRVCCQLPTEIHNIGIF